MTEKNACNHEKKVNDIGTKMLMSHYNSVGYSVYGRNGISKKHKSNYQTKSKFS